MLGEVSDAIAAFHAAMVELGRTDQFGLFTASDFGRNFPSNGGELARWFGVDDSQRAAVFLHAAAFARLESSRRQAAA